MALHEVAADDDQQPGGRDAEFAQSATLQFDGRCGIGPTDQEAGESDGDQSRCADGGEPQTGRNDDSQQRVAEAARFALRQNPILDDPAAPGEGEHALFVGVVAAADRVVVIVDDIGAGMGEQGEQQGHGGFERIESNAGMGRHGETKQTTDKGHGQEGRTRCREVAHQGGT